MQKRKTSFNLIKLFLCDCHSRKVARIVIFSDMQIGTGCSWFDTKGRQGADFNKLWEKYRAFHPHVKVYSIDLKERNMKNLVLCFFYLLFLLFKRY